MDTNSNKAVGLIIGFIFGATNIIRFGPGPNGMMRTLGQYMLGSGATFGYLESRYLGKKENKTKQAQRFHVYRHRHSNRQLPHSYRSFPESTVKKRKTDDYANGPNAKGWSSKVMISCQGVHVFILWEYWHKSSLSTDVQRDQRGSCYGQAGAFESC